MRTPQPTDAQLQHVADAYWAERIQPVLNTTTCVPGALHELFRHWTTKVLYTAPTFPPNMKHEDFEYETDYANKKIILKTLADNYTEAWEVPRDVYFITKRVLDAVIAANAMVDVERMD